MEGIEEVEEMFIGLKKGKIITLEDVAKLNEVFKLAVIAKDMEEFEGKVKEVI